MWIGRGHESQWPSSVAGWEGMMVGFVGAILFLVPGIILIWAAAYERKSKEI